MNSILITGAFGFIGSNLSRYLKENCDLNLIALDIIEPNNHVYDCFYSWEQVQEISQIDSIIHLAGKAHDINNISLEQDYYDINVGLTIQIFQLFLNSNATKFIFFSSVKAVAETVIGNQLTEDQKCNPQTPYGKSKFEAERYILSQSLPSDKRVYILRPCMIHGPGNKGNLNLLYRLVQKRIPWPLGEYANLRSFTSIGNLMFIVRELIENDVDPGIYLLADDEPLSTNELIGIIAQSLKKKARIWRIPKWSIRTLAKFGDIFHLPLTNERLKKLTESYVVSNKKIKSALGVTSLPFAAKEGLLNTLESFNFNVTSKQLNR